MKILYLAFVDLDTPNACRAHVLEVIHNMAKLGHQVVTILPRSRSSIQFPDDVEVSYVHPWNFSWYGKLAFYLLAAIRVCYYFFTFHPTVLYEREICGNPLPALLCRLFRIPLFVEINGLHLDYLAQHGASKFRLVIERWLQAFELHTATGLIISSDLMRTRFIKEYALPSDRCEFILNGCNPHIYSPGSRQAARARLGLSIEAFALVFVGCLKDAYDLLPYFRIFERLKRNYSNLVLWIVGDGPMRIEWEKEAKALGLGGTVKFIGYQSDDEAAEWTRASNLCLVPFTGVGLEKKGALSSTKIWAYAACGRAILLHLDSKQSLSPEFLPLFRCVSPENEQMIESAVRVAMEDPETLDQEGAANARWVHDNATWEHTVRRTIEFMENRIQKEMVCSHGLSPDVAKR